MSLVPFVHLDVTLDGEDRGARIPLATEELHHLTTVLRLRDGAEVEVSDGHGRHALATLERGKVELRAAPTVHARPTPALEIAQALPKARKLDDVIRQLTELDVDAVVPLVTQRCVVRVDGEKAERARQRWDAVARSACEQARRSWRPAIRPVTTLDALVAAQAADTTTVAVVAHPGGAPMRHVVERCRDAARCLMVVGPEGGLTADELEQLAGVGVVPVSLGPTVLRTEHAAAAALAALSYGVGRWG